MHRELASGNLLPTEPIGSIPRPAALIEAHRAHRAGQLSDAALEELCHSTIVDTVRRFEETGSPVVTDGEQRKFQNFATYAVDGLPNLDPDGFHLQFIDHTRVWPKLASGPFKYARRADRFLIETMRLTNHPVKQAVIAPSAVSLFYPAQTLPGYDREQFITDLVDESEAEIRACLAAGAHAVQLDFTEGRLSLKLDPSGGLLASFIDLNNMVLDRFSREQRGRLGVHTCPGGDCDSTHSLDVDYAELLPSLFELNAGNFYISLAREPDRRRVLRLIRDHLRPDQMAFVGVIDVLNPRIETPAEVRDRVLEAAEYIPLSQLGTSDDCGYSPFCDDTSTTRETAFAKIRSRVLGTALAAESLVGRSLV